ncbi:hypothetical protein BC567DRAFT_25616 [Phyllosticta citribraziliensis]
MDPGWWLGDERERCSALLCSALLCSNKNPLGMQPACMRTTGLVECLHLMYRAAPSLQPVLRSCFHRRRSLSQHPKSPASTSHPTTETRRRRKQSHHGQGCGWHIPLQPLSSRSECQKKDGSHLSPCHGHGYGYGYGYVVAPSLSSAVLCLACLQPTVTTAALFPRQSEQINMCATVIYYFLRCAPTLTHHRR